MTTKNALEDLALLESLLRLLARRGVGKARANAILLLAAIEALETLDPKWRTALLAKLSAQDFSLVDEVLTVESKSPIPDGFVEMVLKQAMDRSKNV